jgi:hypothetical protein
VRGFFGAGNFGVKQDLCMDSRQFMLASPARGPLPGTPRGVSDLFVTPLKLKFYILSLSVPYWTWHSTCQAGGQPLRAGRRCSFQT